MEMPEIDVIIIGAGAAGLMAAKILAQAGKKALVLEAKPRCGGRIHTYSDEHFEGFVELGAEFIHGDLPLTLQLAEEAGIKVQEVPGDLYASYNGCLQKDDGNGLSKPIEDALSALKKDISVTQFLDGLQGVSKEGKEEVRGYVSGYYAANLDRASALALKEEWFGPEATNKRLGGGYKTLIDYLQHCCVAAGANIQLQTAVHLVDWTGDEVVVKTETQTFHCRQVIVTVPLGVLQANAINIHPLPESLTQALSVLGFGAVIKIQFQFKEAFWSSAAPHLSMLFSGEAVPTWWTQHPDQNNLITGWLAGDDAGPYIGQNRFEIKEKALQSLANIFSMDVLTLEKNLTAWYVNNWQKGPYARGGYSFATVEGERWKQKNQPYFENKLFFAGEGWHRGVEVGTVEAALQSAKKAAEKILG